MNNPIRQHWVPKVYLRSFCADSSSSESQEQIFVYDLLKGSTQKNSIDKIAVKKHFYTLGKGTENPSFVIENELSKLESDVAPLISELLSNEILFTSSEKRTLFSTFVATLSMRSRQGLQTIYGLRDEVKDNKEFEGNKYSQEFTHAILGLDSEGMRELFAKSVISLSEPLSLHIQAMSWRLLKAEEGYFITSENPLVIFHPTEERWGIATQGSHIHLPISPKLLLHFSKDNIIPGEGTFHLSKAGVTGFNGLTVLSAEQYLLSHTSFEGLKGLIDNRPVGKKRAFGPK